MVLSIEVKVDPDGHMYGSVAALDIVRLFEKEGIAIERRNVVLPASHQNIGRASDQSQTQRRRSSACHFKSA